MQLTPYDSQPTLEGAILPRHQSDVSNAKDNGGRSCVEMELETIIVPYDSGQENARMGAGPQRLFASVVEPLLGQRATGSRVSQVAAAQSFLAEIATAFQLNRSIAEHVRVAREGQRFPLVLSGNCNAAIGTVAGLGSDTLGVIWFDAHGDFNTPETTPSGFFDGMGLAIVAGLCWKELAASVSGFHPVSADRILHVGGRDLDAAELHMMRQCGVGLCTAADVEQLYPALQRLRARTADVYLHLDLDVIAQSEGEANGYWAPGGLPVATIVQALARVREQFNVVAVGVASYDPAYDGDGRVAAAAARFLGVLL
jgi:arginase